MYVTKLLLSCLGDIPFLLSRVLIATTNQQYMNLVSEHEYSQSSTPHVPQLWHSEHS